MKLLLLMAAVLWGLLNSRLLLLQLGPPLKSCCHLQHHLLPLCLVLPAGRHRTVLRLLLLFQWAAADAVAGRPCLCCRHSASCCGLSTDWPAPAA
jgi:hypothetical protein